MIYQSEYVLMKHVGLIKEVEFEIIRENEVVVFEGTDKQIEAEGNRLLDGKGVIQVDVYALI